MDYAFICLGLVAFAIFMYVVLDGFDLGVGILFPFFNEQQQEIALKTIAPLWDGNETWLILGGALLFAAFPHAYSTLLPAFYLPLMLMLCALVVRGVAFEFRAKAEKSKHVWARAFFLSSLIATFSQGVILGTYIQISHQAINLYENSKVLWNSPFVFLCGMGLCFGYALLGSGWLVAKTCNSMRDKARHLSLNLYISAFIILAAITIITPLVNPMIAKIWFSDSVLFLTPLPLLSGGVLVWAFYQTKQGADFWPFYGAVFMFLGCFLGLAISLYPDLLPSKSYQELASHESALRLIVTVSMVLLPMLIGYSGYAYWVFRGKVEDSDSFYH